MHICIYKYIYYIYIQILTNIFTYIYKNISFVFKYIYICVYHLYKYVFIYIQMYVPKKQTRRKKQGKILEYQRDRRNVRSKRSRRNKGTSNKSRINQNI